MRIRFLPVLLAASFSLALGSSVEPAGAGQSAWNGYYTNNWPAGDAAEVPVDRDYREYEENNGGAYYAAPRDYYAAPPRYAPPPLPPPATISGGSAQPAPVYGPAAYEWLPPPRPASCGVFRYWDGERCADARLHPPYIGPRW
jgi:hypothetical protein